MVAQPLKMVVKLDVSRPRRTVRRMLALAREANAEMARFEERVSRLRQELAEYGIAIEIEEEN